MRRILMFLVSVALVPANAVEPGQAALDFLVKVRDKKVKVVTDGDTAISPHVTDTKRSEIARRLSRMANDLKGGELEIGPVNVDGDIAAAIVRKTGGYDPSHLRIFPIGLVKKDNHWRVAPVPASFENATIGYTLELRQRIDVLVSWMLAEQNLDLERSRAVLLDRMRDDITARILPERLKAMTVEEAGTSFLKACEAKDVPMLLGLLGGLSSELPEDWSQRLKIVEGLRAENSGVTRAWKLLCEGGILRVMVHHETGKRDGLFTIACCNPKGQDSEGKKFASLELLHLELSKDREGLWRVDPPPPFFEDQPTDGEEVDDDFDKELLETFPEAVRRKYPASPAATADEAWLKLRTSITDRNSHFFLSSVDFPDNKSASNASIRAALTIWWSLSDPESARYLLPLSFRQDGGEAIAVVQFFSGREPEHTDLRVLRFVRNGSGWLWHVSDINQPLEQIINPQLAAWCQTEIIKWNGQWQEKLLSETVRLEKFPTLQASSNDEASDLIKSYLDALVANDIGNVLGKMAWLANAGGAERMLRNLGYEISTLRRLGRAYEFIGVFNGKNWAAVGIKMGQESTTECILYPVVMTQKGPKILLEVDLLYARKRAREFLNRVALDRLGNKVDAEVERELRDLYKSFDEKVKSLEMKQGE